jgi:hypothetical protein
MLTLTPISSDNFTRPNESPLSQNGNWVVPVGSYSADYLQIVSDQCEIANAVANEGIEYYTGVTTPNNQYASGTIAAFTGSGSSVLQLCIRSADPTSNDYFGNTYVLEVYNNNPNLGASSDGVALLYSYSNGDATFLGSDSGFLINLNDVYTFAVVGTTLYVLQNGNQLFSLTNATFSSGKTALSIESTSSQAGCLVSDFVMGSASTGSTFSISGNAGVGGATVSYSGQAVGSVVANSSGAYTISGLSAGSYTLVPSLAGYSFSPASLPLTITSSNLTNENFTAAATHYSYPDCRRAVKGFGPGPNTPVNVNGTLTYTGQTSCNPAIPPKDSRVKKPSQSSVSPQNSRNPARYT